MGFLERYYIDTALLVIIHIGFTQKWAAGYNPPLRFGKRIERRYVYKLDRVYGLYILHTQRCWWGCKLQLCHIWREDIVTPFVVTYAVTLQRVCECM